MIYVIPTKDIAIYELLINKRPCCIDCKEQGVDNNITRVKWSKTAHLVEIKERRVVYGDGLDDGAECEGWMTVQQQKFRPVLPHDPPSCQATVRVLANLRDYEVDVLTAYHAAVEAVL